jgi:hypothetical protein
LAPGAQEEIVDVYLGQADVWVHDDSVASETAARASSSIFADTWRASTRYVGFLASLALLLGQIK